MTMNWIERTMEHYSEVKHKTGIRVRGTVRRNGLNILATGLLIKKSKISADCFLDA